MFKNIKKFWLLIGTVALVGFLLIKNQSFYVDEVVHQPVAAKFCHADFTIHPNLTNIPAYHTLIAIPCALLSLLVSADSLPAFRLFSLLISLSVLPLFYRLAVKQKDKKAKLKTLAAYLLPVSFPFFYLVYTDIPALLFVLLAWYFVVSKKYGWSGIAATISVAIRQNNIVWLFFMVAYIFFTKYLKNFSIKKFFRFIQSIWSYILGTVAFGAFVFVNGGISLAKAEEWAHPSFRLYFGNTYLILFYFFILFLPLNIANFKKILIKVRKRWGLIVLLSLVGLYGFYLRDFLNTHPYNQHTFATHNWVLVYFTQTVVKKLIFYLTIVYSIYSLWVTKLYKKMQYLIYPFTFLFLAPSWLIEPRYFIVPFTLFHLFRRPGSDKQERKLVLWQGVIAAIVFFGIATKRFFP